MAPQRRWKVHQQQLALLEFCDMSSHCPPGVYVTWHPSNPGQWSGVYFVRRGSYATALLRFKLVFPKQYPDEPPALIFSNDLFHPLVCPLTTYTYSTASPARQPVSSADDKRLSPGSLNLQHQFPMWFEGSDVTGISSKPPSSPLSGQSQRNKISDLSDDDEFNHVTPEKPAAQTSRMLFMPPPKPDALEWSTETKYPSIAEVLRYMVRAFEDDELLDAVPLDAAANSSAHHAWIAYRKRVKEVEAAKEAAKARTADGAPSTPVPQPRFARSQGLSASPRGSPAQWNWDGVWQDRVRKSVRSATADGKLYKDEEGDEHQLITFLDREKEELMGMKSEAMKAGKAMASPFGRQFVNG